MSKGILETQLENSNLGLRGETPKVATGATTNSELHKESSINNNPEISRPASSLDLDGKTPAKYLDKLSK
jgi:hypothetical protein